jgi:hypothetical protein
MNLKYFFKRKIVSGSIDVTTPPDLSPLGASHYAAGRQNVFANISKSSAACHMDGKAWRLETHASIIP